MDGLPVFEVRVEGDDIYVKGQLEEVRTSKRQPHMCAHGGDQRLFVLVGGGAGSAAAAQELRTAGYAGRILVISKENALPYDRPKLSKAMTVGLDSILLRNQTFWDEHGIQFKLGTVVTELNAATKTITTDDGETITYDACLVATGGNPRGLPLPKESAAAGIVNDFKNVYLLRNFDQASVIDSEAQGKKVVIVGSSFIGMEIAAAISAKASSVSVVGMEKVPFERVLGEQVGESLQALHESKGIKFHMKATVSDVEYIGDRVTKLKLNTGAELEADLICVGAGVIPATSFIKGVELAKPDNSLLCDAFMRVTGAQNLYAAGDIARFPLTLLNDRLVRIEHWGMALKQGQVAARNMVADLKAATYAAAAASAASSSATKNAGIKPESIDSVPYFWTGMYGKTVRYCGHGLDVAKLVVDGGASFEAATIKFLVFYSDKDGKIVACASIARDPLVSICAELMHQGRMPNASELEDAIEKAGSAETLLRSLLEDKH